MPMFDDSNVREKRTRLEDGRVMVERDTDGPFGHIVDEIIQSSSGKELKHKHYIISGWSYDHDQKVLEYEMDFENHQCITYYTEGGPYHDKWADTDESGKIIRQYPSGIFTINSKGKKDGPATIFERELNVENGTREFIYTEIHGTFVNGKFIEERAGLVATLDRINQLPPTKERKAIKKQLVSEYRKRNPKTAGR